MNLIFFGTPAYALSSLEMCLKHPDFQVLAVVTQPDKRRGRGTELIPSPVKALAVTYNLPVLQPQRLKQDRETLTYLRQTAVDAFVVVAYGQILSQEILDLPRLGCINAHGSLLPQYRGAAPIQWCLYDGLTTTGVTTMQMDAGMDTGPMLLKGYTTIGLLDNAQDLAAKLATLSASLLETTLLQLKAQVLNPIPQDNSQATYAPLLQKQHYLLDWSRTALDLHNQIRGFYPHCVAEFRGQAVKVLATLPWHPDLPIDLASQLPEAFLEFSPELVAMGGKAPLGSIINIVKGLGPVLQAGGGYLLLQTLQLAGKRPQTGWDFANGLRLSIGEAFGNGQQVT
ncbi:methionyl-tRNA formyltransferase [Neosynechococcus sphagnicola sy1]|uniref:Methionyl-tRNA formyltransferase n=1 Tax=Neosynechococcus sphagnicola sy1 TaxID=1497020 RepID=A0A098TJT3_9CYAN|nr:methionyl-tRNA formyltransferase [Neosynechococcus sphagnicola]KGF72585.1 methionyl-tRNA formyltransferase [Neosynechococcus sphagnicola sy1]